MRNSRSKRDSTEKKKNKAVIAIYEEREKTSHKDDSQLTHDVDGTLMIEEDHSTVVDVDVLLPPNFVLHADPSNELARDDSGNSGNQSSVHESCYLLLVGIVYFNTYRAFSGHLGLNRNSGIGTTRTRNETSKTAVIFA